MKQRVQIEKKLGYRVTVRLDLPSYVELQNYSSSEGFTPSLLIRHLVKRFLDNQRKFKIDTTKGISI
ncbi:MAG: hypothetical protein ACYDG4_04195 [Desulfuromonadaceae bacterium]